MVVTVTAVVLTVCSVVTCDPGEVASDLRLPNGVPTHVKSPHGGLLPVEPVSWVRKRQAPEFEVGPESHHHILSP